MSSQGVESTLLHPKTQFQPALLQAEDSRDESLLLELIKQLKPGMTKIAGQMARAAGRIASFKSWEILSKKYVEDPKITDTLAIAARFPENGFPKAGVFEILKTFPSSPVVVETMLYLNLKEAFQYAITLSHNQSVIASNLWRSKDFLTPEILKTYYKKYPRATIYSVYRSRTKGIIKAEEIKEANLENRAYGCLVCDNPEVFLKDPAWQVRISAVKASNSIQAAIPLLEDDHELVRVAALRVYLNNSGDPVRINPDLLNPMQAEIMVSILKNTTLTKTIFSKKGLFSEVAAPYMNAEDRNLVISGHVSEKARIMFMENQWGKGKSRSYAKEIFQKKDSAYALQYLLYQKEGVDKEEIVRLARSKGNFNSELRDFGYLKPSSRKRPLIFYRALMKKISTYRGFEIVTDKGTIRCDFFNRDAPLTCFNFISLAEKKYFNRLFFHRIIPAFVSQDGDPSGTGSGGPGYSIPCEYNEIQYDREGRVGMALAGKDTGGSQYFITHLATPHLNHQYTIFAQVVSGIDTLADLCQYDHITEIRLY